VAAGDDAKQALDDLTEISSQVRSAVLLSGSGTLLACTAQDSAAAERLKTAVLALLEEAGKVRHGLGPGALMQLEAATLEGSVFVVRDGDRVIGATTSPEPTVGLVFYDLKSALRSAGGNKPTAPAAKPRKPKPKKEAADGDSKKPSRAPKAAEEGDATA
jgi:predicted regulator of Ras-like GTPase activity (Roadblock/LC7/MglB family)